MWVRPVMKWLIDRRCDRTPRCNLHLLCYYGSFFRNTPLLASGWEAVGLSASRWLSGHTVCVAQHNTRWRDTERHHAIQCVQHNLALHTKTQYKKTTTTMHHKRKVYRNSRNIKKQQIRVALSHRPAVITERGGSSNWCQMLFIAISTESDIFREWV